MPRLSGPKVLENYLPDGCALRRVAWGWGALSQQSGTTTLAPAPITRTMTNGSLPIGLAADCHEGKWDAAKMKGY